MPLSRIAIGIQARSTSTRLPGKSMMQVGTRPMVETILKTAVAACNNISTAQNIEASVWLLIPKGDELERVKMDGVSTITGEEDDVLGRYVKMAKLDYPDFIVRITGDCPLIPRRLIKNAINSAVYFRTDYTTNTLAETRTAPDGWDIEIISNKMLSWIDENAKGDEREHVTSILRNRRPPWRVRIGHIMHPLDLSHIKISVDTDDDLKVAREEHAKIERKIANCGDDFIFYV